ncbi:alpha/beta hydrolase fold-3 domain containing protein [Penicillium sp. IBT 35674x]|nr:alpha/beta hydrolase fold-3 domain containing protein [Penicillium sp. IBT 35674x]
MWSCRQPHYKTRCRATYFFYSNLTFCPHQIIFAGDSSGANLAAALLRYLYEFGSTINIPTPKCAVLLPPWVDPFYLNTAGNPQCSTDFIPATYAAWGAYAYAGSCSEPWANFYITQLGHPVPTFVSLFAVEMRGIEGNIVGLHHEEDAVHDTYLIGQLIGFEESAWSVAARVAEFVQNL